MKIKLLLLIVTMTTTFSWSQSKVVWQKQNASVNTVLKENHQSLKEFQTFSLNTDALRQSLNGVTQRNDFSISSNTILSFPNSEGKLERFSIKEASVMHPDLQARFPEIRSYVGQGVDDASSVLRFSLSPEGFSGMLLSANGNNTFIEPINQGSNNYVVFSRNNRVDINNDFECTVIEQINQSLNTNIAFRNADDSILRTYRLAVSATGEYTQFHGGTKAQALAAIVTTMTRVNGIFEVDFNVTTTLIANTDDVIYTSTASDPYGNTTGGYNSALQSTLTSEIGEANYDIGHLFANLQNNGNAGCIGCVCVNNQKGSGWTSATNPIGDFFDVDYVAHEMGHQFGANHTWTHGGNEGTNVQFEPGSGSTIMSYAGITGANTDVQANVTPNFHAASIEQVTDYIKTTSCQTNTNTGNAVPVVNAGSNYTIPRGTAFVLDGSATDADAAIGSLTYSWEQMDENNASSTIPSATATTGVAFRAYEPTTDSDRYFPRLETIKTGATSWKWEVVPNVGRTLNFRLTVRDNVAGGGTNNSDDMAITVNGTAGPFVLNSPNTGVTWNAGTIQAVTWDVAGTTGNGVNAANVDIFLSTDGGNTYTISLASGVTNDGSHDIIVPNNQGNQNRIMVRGSNNIFFDISNTNFTIAGQVVCNADVPIGLAASNVATTSATLSWDAVPGATYDLRYREVGTSIWTTNAVTGISSGLTGLSALTQYESQVRSKCSGGSNSTYSSSVNFTTTEVQLNYCASSGNTSYQTGVSRVIFGTIDNSDGPVKDVGYEDFTNISTTVTQSTSEDLTVYVNTDGNYRVDALVWIDWNQNGVFTDSGEAYDLGNISNVPNGALPTLSVSIPASAQTGSTRMRVSARYNADPTSCQTGFDGEVEDYTVIVQTNGPDTEAPIITLNGVSSIDLNVGDIYTELGATATDNIDGDITGNIVVAGDVVNVSAAGVYQVTYNVSDVAGNAATEVVRTVTVTADTTAPVITLTGASTINFEQGDSYADQGATATDNIDGNLTSSIVVGGDTVNTNIVGSYVITYNVSDNAGNAAVEVTRTVNVNQDTTIPVITLIGASTINLNIGDSYIEPGATALDNFDGDITGNIVITGTVNTASAGTYFVNYNVNDIAGNSANTVTRMVVVAVDTTAPIINLIGASTINLITGDTYTDQGATATDNVDGNLTGSIVIVNSVDTNNAGNYSVTYNVSDAAGNVATEVVRTVNVSDPSMGCSGGISTFPYTEGFEGSIGAWSQSTTDDLNWLVDAGGTPSSGTGPTSAIQGSDYIYVEASGNGTGYPDKRAIITSPCFDLSALTSPTFSFKYHMFGAADMGSITLEVSDDDGVTWTSLWNQTGNQGNQWLTVDLDLSAYAGGNIQLRFNRFVGSTWQADIAIDDVQLLEPAAPTCSDGIQNGDETGVDCGGSSCAPCSTSNVVLNEGYFETGLDSWTDGGSDCARVSSANSYEGNYSIRIRDNSGVSSSMTLSNIDVTPYSSIEVDFYFYVFSMENNEDFWLRFFDGSSWNTVQTWVRGTDIENNTFYNATVTITPAQYNFAVNSGFRFQNDASGNQDQIFIDQVTITGISGASKGKADSTEIVGYGDSPEISELDIRLYPNPVKGNMLNVEIPSLDIFKYRIVDLLGKTVSSGTSEGKVDISELDGGLYFIEVNDGDEIITKKFIKN
ncbi:immunoglobulin-like domain-containing protein [Winogradskyella sp.]|uniref:immunoglobulin-like domain-containing protein n=1 Tax=Winogradskyella sp. TaxID=1883156 RepID=UPI0025D9DBD4|nr:immunoglobulin-like domain-containing protein [Winogradskyella sp.]